MHQLKGWRKKVYTYTGRPVEGTIARGDMMPYALKNDSAGYVQSAAIKSPVSASDVDMKNAERLYLVNCGICHGTKLDGNGPLYKGGDGPYTAAPKKLYGCCNESHARRNDVSFCNLWQRYRWVVMLHN